MHLKRCEARHSALIYCEPNQLKQVFINILKKIEVMPDGGNVYV